jgi:hypothetical protein
VEFSLDSQQIFVSLSANLLAQNPPAKKNRTFRQKQNSRIFGPISGRRSASQRAVSAVTAGSNLEVTGDFGVVWLDDSSGINYANLAADKSGPSVTSEYATHSC